MEPQLRNKKRLGRTPLNPHEMSLKPKKHRSHEDKQNKARGGEPSWAQEMTAFHSVSAYRWVPFQGTPLTCEYLESFM